MTTQLYRSQATADYFQISKMTLWRWAQLEGFPKPMKRGSVVLYNVQKIKQWLEMGEAAND